MSSGRVNSKGSLETASRVFRSFGRSWAAVERAAVRDENGVYVVKRNGRRLESAPVGEPRKG
jgi:hypothetical protein